MTHCHTGCLSAEMDCLSFCFSSLSHYVCLFSSFRHPPLTLLKPVFTHVFLSSFNPSMLSFSSLIALLLFCLFQPPLCIPPLPSLFSLSIYIYTFVIISASLSRIPPPLCVLPSLPLFPPFPLPPTHRWRGVNMSSTCGLIVPSQQSKTTTLKLLNRLHHMTSASSLLCSYFFSSPPLGLRCLTTMKQCLAGRIRQER